MLPDISEVTAFVVEFCPHVCGEFELSLIAICTMHRTMALGLRVWNRTRFQPFEGKSASEDSAVSSLSLMRRISSAVAVSILERKLRGTGPNFIS